jgi:Fic family protein
MGRLLITFWLCQQKMLSQPLLYLSYFFKLHRDEYYDKLTNVRILGDWEGWIKFFLEGVAFVANEAVLSANEIIDLHTKNSEFLSRFFPSNNNYQRLLNLLFESLLVSKKEIANILQVSYPTASTLVETMLRIGILHDVTPNQSRNKTFLFRDYLNILERGTEQQ